MARKILLADDSVTAQNMGRKILADAGYEVVTVNNGSAALKKVAEAQPELIVLDVYMPGYSGLEVCQRIKDSRETSHIPVLLTVGKLEPFKQDEARRVRADAFIIKPFEASELMAAVTKLESKLGTLPAPRKEGRHPGPATMESFERTATARGPQYGDEESGWKSRIKFPTSESRRPEPDPEPETFDPPSSSNFREIVSDKPASSATPAMPDRPMPAGIPQDITPDEIAAIAAAAARVKSGVSVGKNFERLTDETPAPEQKIQAPPEEFKTEEIEPASAPSARETTTAVSASPLPAEIVSDSKAAVAKELKLDEAVSPTTASTISAPEQVAPLPSIVETATPATLSVGSMISQPAPAVAPPWDKSEDLEPVTVAAIGSAPELASAPVTTPAATRRWIAEEIPLEASESALVLEREMHKAYAAFAAAEYGQPYKSAPVDRDDEPMFATMAPPAIGTPLPMMQDASTKRSSQPHTEGTIQTTGSIAAIEPTLRDISHPAEVSKPPAPPFSPAGPARDDSGHAVVAFGGPELMGGPETTTPPTSAQAESPAISTIETKWVDPTLETKPPDIQATKPSESAPSDGRGEDQGATTAAAWANWRDVRDSVLGPKDSPQPAKTDLEELKKSKGQKKDDLTPATQPEAAMAAAASAESASSDPNLSSIVDNMLAELKPKLMAELAEKLKKEKSKK